MHVDQEHGQPAKTRYRVVDTVGKTAAWVELEPLTGRTHQLRVHLDAIGHPIVGDGKYGGPRGIPYWEHQQENASTCSSINH